MGHVRLGKMPATLKWKEVVALLGDQPSIPDLAEAVERASDVSLAEAVKDPGFVEALWLLLQIPKAAKSRISPARSKASASTSRQNLRSPTSLPHSTSLSKRRG